jgi:hypothetical protein
LAADFNVLVFSKTLMFRHASITNGIAAIKQLGAENHFNVDATEDASYFTPKNLARYQVVIFLSTSGNILDEEQQAALKNFIEQGGGLAAIHAAVAGDVATAGNWPWYGEALCARFTNHSSIVEATVNVEDRKHPSTAPLPEHWVRKDEWYNFIATPRDQAHVLAALDETTYKGSFTLPEYYGAGFSVTANKKLTVAADYRLQKWSTVKSENGLSSYVDSRKLSVGLQYIPASRLPKNYFERIYYQAGASVEKSYLRLNGTIQNNYSVSAGLCLPLHFQKSYVHVGVQEGQKGSVSNILFRETYTLVTFGIVMHDFWFIKSKFD